MNLIKLNPLKKLMLVVLSWFVHSVYNVEVYAWKVANCTSAKSCGTSCSAYLAACCGTGYVSAVNGRYGLPAIGLHLYMTQTATESGVYPSTYLVCFNQSEVNAITSGNTWVQNNVGGNCGAYLSNCGNMNQYLTGKRGLLLISGVAGSSAIQVPDGQKAGYTGGCSIKSGYYISGFNSCIRASTCPAGYYCPGGSIGNYADSSSGYVANAGRTACGAGYYCSGTGRTTRVACPKGSYSSATTATSCSTCPSQSGVAGTTAGTGTQYLTQCYIPAGSGMSYTGGHTIAFLSNCYYS